MEDKNTITISSTRVYMDELKQEDQNVILMTFFRFNRMKEWYYNQSYNERYLGIPFIHENKTETSLLKEKYRELFGGKLMDYYVTSLFSAVNGMRKSQRELLTLHAKELEERQANRREKVSALEEKLTRMLSGKAWLKAYGKYLAGKCPVPEAPSVQKQGFTFSEGKVCFRGKGNRIVREDPRVYEWELERRICRMKSRIAQIRDKIDRAEKSKSSIPPRITFGSKKQYRKKDTLSLSGKVREEWHKERDFARNRIVNFSGRTTSKDGNFLCRYDGKKATMSVTMINGTAVTFCNVSFPYRGKELEEYLADRKGSVGYTMERKIDGNGREYLVFKAVFTQKKTDINYSTSDGVLAYDFNYDHIAWADVSAEGNLLRYGTIPFCLEGLSSGHAKVVLGTAVKKLVSLAAEKKKPIVREDLDFVRKKARMEYQDKKKNRKLSSLIYSRSIAMVEARAFREDVAVLAVNPAYTSLIAKVKYIYTRGISIHCAAAYVIGRRALGFEEKVPAYLSNLVTETKKNPWKSIFAHAKKAASSYFREKQPVWEKWKSFDTDVRTYKEDYQAWRELHAFV